MMVIQGCFQGNALPNSYKEKYGDFPGHEIYELTLKLKDIHHALRLVHST